jgi:spoIIIJ-associated protein
MKKTLEKSGRTEEDAINAALLELGMERDDVSVEILERAKSGFLGIGAVHAVVRVTYDAPDEPEAKKPEPKAERSAAPQPAEPRRTETVRPAPAAVKKPNGERTIPDDERRATGEDAENTRRFLEGLLERMGVQAELDISNRDDGGINVDVCGAGMGAIIGRRGETLDAI